MARYSTRSSTRGSSSGLHRRRNPSTTSSSSTSNPRIGWPSNVSGSPSALRSTGTTTPAAATDPVGIAVIAPPDGASTSTNCSEGAVLAPARAPSPTAATTAVIANGRTVGQRPATRYRITPSTTPQTAAPTSPPMIAGTRASLTDALVPVPPNTDPAATVRPRPTATTRATRTTGSRRRIEPSCGRFASVSGHVDDASDSSPRRVCVRRTETGVTRTEQAFGGIVWGNGRPKASGPRR